jgi:membrane protease YdiL (CAAX protease family)
MSETVLDPSPRPIGETYWIQSRQPLASLLFIAPLLLTYEAAVIVLGPHAIRNGADAWLRLVLDHIGFGQYFLLPILTVCILLAWHHTTHQPWRVHGHVFYGMVAESIFAAIALRILLQVQGSLLETLIEPGTSSAPANDLAQHLLQTVRTRVGYFGAGIYEELLFRLILLSLLMLALHALRLPKWSTILLAVVASSLLFSAAHYVGGRETFTSFSFLFRFLAGVFFSLLFLYRGFGIAAGAHAGYDILVGFI